MSFDEYINGGCFNALKFNFYPMKKCKKCGRSFYRVKEGDYCSTLCEIETGTKY